MDVHGFTGRQEVHGSAMKLIKTTGRHLQDNIDFVMNGSRKHTLDHISVHEWHEQHNVIDNRTRRPDLANISNIKKPKEILRNMNSGHSQRLLV